MDTASYSQSVMISRTAATIWEGVNVGPLGYFRGSLAPVANTLTCVPPTSITNTCIARFRMIASEHLIWTACYPSQHTSLLHTMTCTSGQIQRSCALGE